MLAADSLGRLLLKQGWKQGVLFTAPSAAFLYNDIADSADATSWTSVSRNTKKNEQFVLISQTCDIVASIDDEPYVEALICKVTRNRQFLAAIDRNSARYFVVDLEAGLVAQAKYRLSIKKQSLTALSPRPWPSDEKRFERFVSWLARRYDRPALPDELVKLFQTPVRAALERLDAENADLGRAFSAAIYQVRVSLPPNDQPPFPLQLVLMVRGDALSQEQLDAIDAVVEEIRNSIDPLAVHLDQEALKLNEDQMTVKEYFRTRPLYLEYMTYRGDEVVGAEPPRRA